MNNLNPIIVKLLKKRGIAGDEAVAEFLSDKPKKTYDPFLLQDLEAGVDLIISSINSGDRICIYGDYDADGVTSVSILMDFLGGFYENLTYYIPSRFDEGYGLNKPALQKIYDEGSQLVITVDCGSVSREEVEFAKDLGLKMLVTDHHTIKDVMADCLLINPKRPDSTYPCKDLAGCGVAFKLVQGLQRKLGRPKSEVNRLLDLVAVGTIGDIVPLVDENRTLVKYGLSCIRRGGRPGLSTLIKRISLKPESISSENVAFGIVPHINAAGRMKDAKLGVELLRTHREWEGEKPDVFDLAQKLVENNQKRKKVQEETYEICHRLLLEQGKNGYFHLIYSPQAHEGIAGIVAGKLKDKYERPTLILTDEEEGFIKGTGRSIKSVNLYEVLASQSQLFERFGGHSGACGLLMKKENLEALRQGLVDKVKELYRENEHIFDLELEWDLELETADADLQLAKDLQLLEPFGQGNEKPVVKLSDVCPKWIKYLGPKEEHVRFNIEGLECILFSKAQDYRELLDSFTAGKGSPVTVYGALDISSWNGRDKVQLQVSRIEEEQ